MSDEVKTSRAEEMATQTVLDWGVGILHEHGEKSVVPYITQALQQMERETIERCASLLDDKGIVCDCSSDATASASIDALRKYQKAIRALGQVK